MKKIRDLLADCRIELRTLMRDFQKSELCRRIDEARVELARDESPAAATAAASASPADSVSSDRVAQAWRIAAEDLRVTAPAIYQLLAKKVAQQLASMATNAVATDGSDVVNASIATPEPVAPVEEAVATESAAPSAHAVDVAQAATPEVVVDEPVPPANPLAPSRDDLLAISRHKRRFSEAQREWCVGEALIRSGFMINPNDFVAGGDHAMALYLLESEATAS